MKFQLHQKLHRPKTLVPERDGRTETQTERHNDLGISIAPLYLLYINVLFDSLLYFFLHLDV